MAFFHVVALAILTFWLSYKGNKTLTDVIPVGVSLLTLFLYGLSFVNGLMWSDYLAVFVCLFTIFTFVRMKPKERSDAISYVVTELKKPGSIVALALLLTVPVLVSGKVVTWWDDYNFWATDAASLFYLNGFTDKYHNVAAEFGDYPPGTQMMKWWFLHFSPGEFREGLLFSGYYFMNLAFLTPLLKCLKKRNFLVMILMAVALWLFPSTVEVFGYDGCCADLTMAIVYGAFLMAVMDRQGHGRFFYYGRQTLFLMVLMLCKNTGFLWVGFGLLFAYGYHIWGLKERSVKGLLAITLFPIVTECSWLLFCLVNRRVAKLTGAAFQMAAGSMNIPEVKKELVNSFFTAFLRYPLHRGSTFAIDVSPFTLYLLLLLFVFLLYLTGRLEKSLAWYLGVFLGISGACFYIINLISHLTIFAVETQYLEPFGMVSSIERYGAPFTIGSLYLTAYIALSGEKIRNPGADENRGKWQSMVCCLLFVFLTADYESAYRGLWGYRETLADTFLERQEIVDEQAEEFLVKVGARTFGNSYRVLYLRDLSDISWVRNTYVNYGAAPVSVMHGNVDADTMVAEDIQRMVEESHTGYLYAEEIQGGQELFMNFTQGEPFVYGCLYRVVEQNGRMLFDRVE